MIPDLICCLRTSKFLRFEVPQMSNYLGTQRTGIKFFWQPISPQSYTFGSRCGLCLVAVKSPLILYFSVNVDFACVHVSLPDVGTETPRCVFSLFMTLCGTNIISATTVASITRISTKQYNPLVAVRLIQQFYKSTWSEVHLGSPRQNIRAVWVAVTLLFKPSAGYALSRKILEVSL